jgi:cystathionine gamma-synthase
MAGAPPAGEAVTLCEFTASRRDAGRNMQRRPAAGQEGLTGPMEQRSLSPQTLAAQALGEVDLLSGGLAPVINPATNYERQPDGSYRQGREYTRADNPTYEHAERLLAALEGAGCACALFASGMAAATAVFQSLLPGDHVLVSRVLYWGVRKWLAEFALTWGLDVEFTDTTDLGAVAAAIRPGRTRLLWLETPANPMWEITDLAAVCDLAHSAGVRVAADNTVATPVLTRPLEHGADLVVHSATKYLNGHSDVLAGAVLTARRDPFWERLRSWRRNAGAVPGPFEAWLLQRGMRTLFLRVHRASDSALAIAAHLAAHPEVAAVLYPGLPSHPGHQIAARQMTGGFGGMLSIRLAGGAERALAVLAAVRVFKRATSLGGVESLIEHRRTMEGPSSPVPADLLRLSVGIEDPADLLADLDAALDAAGGGGAAAAPPAPTAG